MIHSRPLRSLSCVNSLLRGSSLRCASVNSSRHAPGVLRCPRALDNLKAVRCIYIRSHSRNQTQGLHRRHKKYIVNLFSIADNKIPVHTPAEEDLLPIAAEAAGLEQHQYLMRRVAGSILSGTRTDKSVLSEEQLSALNIWIWNRFRCFQFASETAAMLQHQEEHGGDLSKIPDHLKEGEKEMLRIAAAWYKEPPKLSGVGVCSREVIARAVFLLGKDRQRQSLPPRNARWAAQLVAVSSYYFDVAMRLGNIDAALYLVHIGTDVFYEMQREAARIPIPDPELGLAKEIIIAEVHKDTAHCSWPLFSTYMDLYYSQESLQKSSSSTLAAGIANMYHRIEEGRFDLPKSVEDFLPLVQLPHKHLLRILNHCLYKQKPPTTTITYKDKPLDLTNLRQFTLEDLAANHKDAVASFILAIEDGDFNSERFKKLIPTASCFPYENAHYGSAQWFRTLRQWQEAGMLDNMSGAVSRTEKSDTAPTQPLDFDTWYKDYSENMSKHPIHQAIAHAIISSEADLERKWFYERVMAFAAICHKFGGPELARNTLESHIDMADRMFPSPFPELKKMLKKLKLHLDDFDNKRPGLSKSSGWDEKKIKDILQRYADPNVLVKRYQSFVK